MVKIDNRFNPPGEEDTHPLEEKVAALEKRIEELENDRIRFEDCIALLATVTETGEWQGTYTKIRNILFPT